MRFIFVFFEVILFFIQKIIMGMVSYLLLLTHFANRASQKTPLKPQGTNRRFLILIPAHNEEKLLPRLLSNLHEVDFPESSLDIVVIADNCTDSTAAQAKKAGAIVYERSNLHEKGKGYALRWVLENHLNEFEEIDAVVVIDADTIVSENFFQVMNSRLNAGERVIQAYYGVENLGTSYNASLRYAALALVHYLRPLGRTVLGGSAGLKGNGMVFAKDIMEKHSWSASVTEDIEFHMQLLLDGERVTFAPDAVVKAEMPDKFADARSQNVRWEQGRIEMAMKYIPALWQEMIARWRQPKKAFVFGDAIMEHLIPPFSVLAAISGLSFICSVAFWKFSDKRMSSKQKMRFNSPGNRYALRKGNLILGTLALLGQFHYLISGLRLVRAPKEIYKAFLYAPGFIIWKIWQYFRVMAGFEKQNWVRTSRNQS